MNKPEKYQTVKQPPGSKVCGAAVAAMVLGKSLEHCLEVGTGGKESCSKITWLAEILAKHGVLMGTFFEVPNWQDGYRSDFPRTLRADFSMNRPMIVGVDSETREGKFHWVFWDGTCIRDPNPDVPDERPGSDYDGHIIDFYPIQYFENE